jgi:hypothetical protein
MSIGSFRCVGFNGYLHQRRWGSQMQRVVPSQVVPFIETLFPWVRQVRQADPDGQVSHSPMVPAHARGLMRLLDRIPEELLQLSTAEFAEWITAVEIIRTLSEGLELARSLYSHEIRSIRSIHRLLGPCPDDAPATNTSDPAFIADPELRADLHRDLGEVNRAIQNGEWKAATVLAGSVVEALLLWALQNRKTPADIQAAARAVGKTIDLTKRPLDTWDLSELIKLARATGIISPSTRAAADQSRYFRNLIHPGRAQRLKRKCNRATALLGAGAVEAVIAELS